MVLEYKIKENDNYINLKDLLKNHFQISDRLLIKLKHNQKIFVNNTRTYVNTSLNLGDIVSIYIDFIEDNSNIVPTYMPLDIVYEDDAFLVVNKPSGVPVHPSMEHFEDSLSNAIKYYFEWHYKEFNRLQMTLALCFLQRYCMDYEEVKNEKEKYVKKLEDEYFK